MSRTQTAFPSTREDVPGGVHLCQAGDAVSCGACCGLYNVADPSRNNLEKMLAARTEAFATAPRDADAILAFGQEIEASQDLAGPCPEFHHCTYLGLIGEHRARVGCLLHPLSRENDGVDFRGLSHYGGLACRTYFCPSHHELNAEIKTVILNAADDWHAYGLFITETALIAALFREIAARLKGSRALATRLAGAAAREAVRDMMRLKRSWPFRPDGENGLCHYFFNDGLYMKPPVRYPESKTARSRYHVIFRELVSAFDAEGALRRAEGVIEEMLDRIAAAAS